MHTGSMARSARAVASAARREVDCPPATDRIAACPWLRMLSNEHTYPDNPMVLCKNSNVSSFAVAPAPPQEYAAAMADVERRALAGELTLAQVRQEIFALRERFGAGVALVMQWAACSR